MSHRESDDLQQIYLQRLGQLRSLSAACGARADSEDVLQDIWLRLQDGSASVAGEIRHPGAYLARMVVNAVSSCSFATMAVIGFGAAALQWFTGAGEDALTLADAISELESRVRSYRSALDDALIPMGELREEWGAQAWQIRELYQAMALLERVRAMRALSDGVAKIRSDFSGLKGDLADIATLQDAIEQRQQAEALGSGDPAQTQLALELQRGVIEKIHDEYGLTVVQAQLLQSTLDGLATAKGPEAQRAALTAMRQVVAQIVAESQNLPPAFTEAAEQIISGELAAWELDKALKESTGSARGLSKVDMTPGIAAAARQASILAQNMGIVLGVALELANIDGSGDAKEPPGPKPRVGFGPGIGRAEDPIPGGVPELRYGENSGEDRPTTRDPRFNPEAWRGKVVTTPARSAGGGGGGGADEAAEAIREQQEALESLIQSEQQQIAMMLETNPVQREIMRNHEALKGVVGEEREEVEQLIADRMRLEEVKSRIDEIGRAGEQAFVGLVTGAMSFKDAVSQLISKLAEMAASAAWDSLWSGLGGSLLGGLFGGSPAPTVVAAADGGRVYGRGGPRDDLVPAWLSNGEYVVNAAATAEHLPLIEAMNAGASMADLMSIIGGHRPAWPAFADGGLWGAINGSSAPSGWGLSGSRPGGGMSGGTGAMRVSVDVRAYFDDKEGKMMAEVQRVSQEVAAQTTAEGINSFSAHSLPSRLAEIDANPRVYG